MRLVVLLASTSLLAACGGGAETISSTPPPVSGGSGTTNTEHTFANPTEAKSYSGIGANQVFTYTTDTRLCCNQQAEIYSGNASTVRKSNITLDYDPRDAIFLLRVNDPLTGSSVQTRFQDPASRTDFGGNLEPQWGTPRLDNPNVAYLQAGDGDPRSAYGSSGTGLINPGDNDTPASGTPGSSYQATTLFYLRPGTETEYVTYAGYARNALSFSQRTENDLDPDTGETVSNTVEVVSWALDRGAFAFGELSPVDNVPTTGTASYSGSMLATMIVNPTIDDINLPNYFQWVEGTSSMSVDFAASTLALNIDGTVDAPQIDTYTGPAATVIAEGATFSAAGRGDINFVQFGGFKGFFDSARFVNPDGSSYTVNIAGSSIDGGFYGPNGEEVGGGFRVVGGNPDERVDIMGAFVGKK